MPRAFETRNTPQPVLNQQATGRQVRARVSASASDNVPNYIPQMKNPDAEAFLQGLGMMNSKLLEWSDKSKQEEAYNGALDRQQGKEAQQSGASYKANYFATDGLIRAQEDGTSLLARYNTEFDKDKGDLEGWLQENYQSRVGGVPDEHYKAAYQRGMTPAFQAIREAHLGYQKKAVEVRVESNAMQLMDNGIRAYTSQGQPIPTEYLSAIQAHVGQNLGVSQQRFGELLFSAVKKVGDEGHYDAYDVLKADRPDGSPGMYYDPKWKDEIDKAEAHSFTAATVMAQKSREQRYNKALYDVFLEEDPKKAQQMFREMKGNDLFKGDTEGLIKWEKLMNEKVDGKPDAKQLENEVALLARVYEGKAGIKEILAQNSTASITSGQRKYLLGEARRVQNENQQAAAAAGKADEAVFKTREYADAKDFVGSMLQPRPRDPMNFSGQQTIEFDRVNQTQAQREFFMGLKGKTPAEIQPWAEDVVKRYKARQKDYTEPQQASVADNKVPFKTLAEVRSQAHLLSPAEIRKYIAHFKTQGN
ncbi:MAG: hypothetical protein H6R13_3010 [Proteobacteria bacterium]|nr:hypothetical protein [Pseudomonadota bacterium]